MPEDRISALQYNIIGKETTRGTAVNPSQRLKAVKVQFNPTNESKQYRAQGDLLPVKCTTPSRSSEASVEGYPDYNELPILFASVGRKPVSELVVTGVYRHTININSRGPSNVQTYTVEYGDANAAERVAFALLAELGLDFNRKEPKVSGKFIGRAVEDQTAITPGSNCQQTLTMGTATAFKLRYEGATVPAAFTVAGLTSAAIQTALQALSTVGTGNMTVSGTGPYTITGAGTLAGVQLPLIEVVEATGGTGPTIDYATGAKGGYSEYVIVPMEGQKLSAYYAASLATLAAGKLTNCFGGTFNIANRFAPVWLMDDTQDSWGKAVESPMNMTTKFGVQADSIAKTMASDSLAQVRKYMRLEFVGPEIVTGQNYRLTVDMSGQVSLADNFRDEDGGLYARDFTFEAMFDPTWGKAVQIVIINNVPSY